ncbi:MAG: hypothetical protein WEB87_03275, partial [Bacteriovoracaceae bacterium]
KNVSESYFDYYSKAFNHLFSQGLAKENFFLQLCMLGGIRFPEGNILEAELNCYEDMKRSASRADISFIEKDVLSCAKEFGGYDLISISDVPSYFSGDIEKNFLQDLRPSLNPGGVVVLRSYLRVPAANRQGFQDLASDFKKEISREKTQMYKVEILQKK